MMTNQLNKHIQCRGYVAHLFIMAANRFTIIVCISVINDFVTPECGEFNIGWHLSIHSGDILSRPRKLMKLGVIRMAPLTPLHPKFCEVLHFFWISLKAEKYTNHLSTRNMYFTIIYSSIDLIKDRTDNTFQIVQFRFFNTMIFSFIILSRLIKKHCQFEDNHFIIISFSNSLVLHMKVLSCIMKRTCKRFIWQANILTISFILEAGGFTSLRTLLW